LTDIACLALTADEVPDLVYIVYSPFFIQHTFMGVSHRLVCSGAFYIRNITNVKYYMKTNKQKRLTDKNRTQQFTSRLTIWL